MAKNSILNFSARLERSDNKLWGSHLVVPKQIAEKVTDGTSRRVICTLNNSETFQCAILNFRAGVRVISVNKKIKENLGLTYGDSVSVQLKKDSSTFGLPMPEEFEEVLRQEKTGKKIFNALSPGKQRTLLYIAGRSKSSEKRVLYAVAIVRHLIERNGKIDYRELNKQIRTAR